jgi:hypothetical protein
MFGIYNANGREIASYDSQPTKYAARELLLRGTLSLNHVVGKTPELGKRTAFVQTRNGRYRSAYSPVPAVIAAGITWPFWNTGLVDIRAALAPSLMAAVTSSMLVAIAVGCAFLISRHPPSRFHLRAAGYGGQVALGGEGLSVRRSLFLALGFGAGTGLWSTASQTLWQHETAIFGLTLAVFALVSLEHRRHWLLAALLGLALGVAAGARFQLAPAIAFMLVGTVFSIGLRPAGIAAACAGLIVIPVLVTNYLWFGTVAGAAPILEAMHSQVHRTYSSFVLEVEGFGGLLVSPNRGLLVFSPIAVVALIGIPAALRSGRRSVAFWLCAAAAAQYVLYSLYSVWWGGHTYGPRYMLDVLPLLIPAAAFGMDALHGRLRIALGTAALAWSVTIAAIGAFNYPQDRWNSEPIDVDRNHERLWDWQDPQILRAWNAGFNSQNFTLFTRDSVRLPQPIRQAQGGPVRPAQGRP